MKNTTQKMKTWFWRLAIALGLAGMVLSQAGPVAATNSQPPPTPPLGGNGYVWGG